MQQNFAQSAAESIPSDVVENSEETHVCKQQAHVGESVISVASLMDAVAGRG